MGQSASIWAKGFTMPLGFSDTPRFWATVNITLPNVSAGATAEKSLTPSTDFPATARGKVGAGMLVVAQPVDPATGSQAAFPAGLVMAHSYFHSDGKLYIRFANVTGSDYTGADAVTFQIVGF